MKHLIVIAVLLVGFAGCSAQEVSKSGIPSLRRAAVVERISREMLTSTQWDRQRYQTTMKSYRDGLTLDVTIKGPKSPAFDSERADVNKSVEAFAFLDSLLSVAAIDTVLVELRTNPEVGDVIDSQPYLLELVAVPYEGADPQRAEDWLREVFMLPESRITIGPAEFILRAPSDNARVLIMRRAG
ncbi:MAG: hypothetical protein IH600_05475 [Bacteroidetes bacterium]|nr:hypothetical protein [Bacteroidota bacterium]